ncbi:hypothetical protein [Paenarthrobacter ureafaciens]|uniref:hypothetical protein n=1 Tax=Paenarthrobacter ureafaciens TaxID=37931 RepID=UPI001FB34C0E|nr:hypothetical protein [Paenarthrobacter ureafaciens]UOD80368.1 hypothetical protein MQZ73_14765 [Paenarthrobacter ureafaciens]WNZ03021.1 hypothetical protein PVT25_15405 [Paenarthrobacter ureafaciens]
MATITQNDARPPLEFATARTFQGEDGRTFVNHSDAMELVRRLAAKDKELLDRLAKQ